MMAALSSIEILLHPENKQDGQEGCKKEGFKRVRNMLEWWKHQAKKSKNS